MENAFSRDLANGLTLDFLENTPAGSMLQSAISTYSKVQTLLLRLSSAEDEGSLTALKIGTVLTEAFLEKFLQGKAPQDLTRADLAEIADRVTDFAVLMDGRDYSIFVFEQYARYIEFSAKLLAARSDARSTDQIGSILAVSQEIRNNSRKLHDGEITEPEYIEDCLWLSLEAILKCFSACLSCTTGTPESACWPSRSRCSPSNTVDSLPAKKSRPFWMPA